MAVSLSIEGRESAVGVYLGIETQARMSPDATAVIFQERSITFADLSQLTALLANRLEEVGITGGDLVGVALPRSLMTVVAILAIFKVGGVYVPVDPDLPGPRLSLIMGDANPKCTITVMSAVEQLPDKGTKITVDDLETAVPDRCRPTAWGSLSLSAREVDANAYIMYTSGSTGIPKGVVIQHSALELFFSSMSMVSDIGTGYCQLALTKTTFDISLLELLYPLRYGGRVVIAATEDVNSPTRLLSLIKRHAVTTLQATPSYLRTAIQECPNLVQGMRVFVGGEPLTVDLAERLLVLGSEIWNLYGPTEATIWASVHRVTRDDVAQGAPRVVTIGRPLTNYRVYVLDENRQAVPAGTDGDLYIAGSALAKEYFRRPSLTEECFSRDTFGLDGARMYRTGDIARFRLDGNLDFRGRVDDQVKIHGIRLELGDVECSLRELPGIRDAVVVARTSVNGDQELVGYVVPYSAERFNATTVRQELSNLVAAHMVPRLICALCAIPLTSHGKVDRSALPDPDVALSRPGRQARSALETQICSLFADVLDVASVNLDDNFFDLGGTSLSGMRFLNQIRAQFKLDLSLRILFETETVAEMIDRVKTMRAATSP